jgi:hypothetical protein
VSNGIFFYGEKETIFVTDARWVVIPSGKGEPRRVIEVQGDNGLKHMQNFLDAVRTRKQPVCQPEDAFFSAATVQLAMISYKSKSRVEWDGRREAIVGNPVASGLLKRAYRAPYRHPYAG